MSCDQCKRVPASREEFVLVNRETLWDASHEAAVLWMCPHCRQPFVAYSWKVVSETASEGARTLYVAVSSEEAAGLRQDSANLRPLFKSRPNFVEEPDHSFWLSSSGVFGPDILPPE